MVKLTSPRWKKLLGDVKAMPGRIAMIVIAIAVGVYGFAAMTTAYSILTREISLNYLGTKPASASIELDAIDDALLDAVRKQPNIAAAEARATVYARIEARPNEWLPMTIFVVQDFADIRLSTFRPDTGAWPPPDGTILLEREALVMLNAKAGDRFAVKTRNGGKRDVVVSGGVHDPSLAPAWQEQAAYGYATPQTLAALGEHVKLDTLKVLVQDRPYDIAAVDQSVAELAIWLKQQGRKVEAIHVPPPGKHPHEPQMTGVVRMLVIFSFLTLLLGAILSATLVGGMLAQQTKQIGVLKAVGACRGQIVVMYLVMVAVLGAVATAVGVPLGMLTGRALSGMSAHNLNLVIHSHAIPIWVSSLQIAAGILVPLAAASFGILRATRITVREAIAHAGANAPAGSSASRRLNAVTTALRSTNQSLSFALRNAFRRPGRLLLTLVLLSAAGAMFIVSLNLKTAWERVGIEAAEHRHYDMEIFLQQAESERKVFDILGRVPGVKHVESWITVQATPLRDDGVAIDRVYPDGGHGSVRLRAIPEGSKLIDPPLLSGRRLQPGEEGSVVLTHNAHEPLGNVKLGDTVAVDVRGHPVRLRVVGIVRQFMTLPTLYVAPATLDRVLKDSGKPTGMSRVYRVVLDAHDADTIAATATRIEKALGQEAIDTDHILTETMMAGIVDGHLRILIVILVGIALLMGTVGMLGLMSAMGANVAERAREFGIMRAVGATSGMVRYTVVAEGLFVGLLGGIAAIVLALPLSMAIGQYLGRITFGLPLPTTVSPVAVTIWLALVVLGAFVAGIFPAHLAARLTVRETLVAI